LPQICVSLFFPEQGDQLGRIFNQWVIVYFGQWFENYKTIAHFWATFFHATYHLCINFDKKIGWATFWAIFSQNNPGTLFPSSGKLTQAVMKKEEIKK
jgi:hypothetical protein